MRPMLIGRMWKASPERLKSRLRLHAVRLRGHGVGRIQGAMEGGA